MRGKTKHYISLKGIIKEHLPLLYSAHEYQLKCKAKITIIMQFRHAFKMVGDNSIY